MRMSWHLWRMTSLHMQLPKSKYHFTKCRQSNVSFNNFYVSNKAKACCNCKRRWCWVWSIRASWQDNDRDSVILHTSRQQADIIDTERQRDKQRLFQCNALDAYRRWATCPLAYMFTPFSGALTGSGSVKPTEQVAQLWQRNRAKLDTFSINVQLLRLRHYQQILVEVGAFQTGVGHFKRKLQVVRDITHQPLLVSET